MKQRLSKSNPFGPTIKGIVWEYLKPLGSRNHLDYGTADGSFLVDYYQTGIIQKGVGLDVNREVISEAQAKLPPAITLKAIQKNTRLDFDDQTFESISIIGVIEHIYDKHFILRELHRLLKKDGCLLVLVPGKHVFSFLDTGNFKFVFPRLHRWVYIRMNSKEQYQKRFVECSDGLFGDIDTQKKWHQHFSFEELKQLLSECGFTVTQEDGLGLFRRVILNIELLLPGRLKKLTLRLKRMDAGFFHQSEILVVAQKIE